MMHCPLHTPFAPLCFFFLFCLISSQVIIVFSSRYKKTTFSFSSKHFTTATSYNKIYNNMLRRSCSWLVAFTPIFMPSLSPSMETGRIVEWKKKVGDKIDEGDVWCTVETDKATVDYTNAVETGYLANVFVQNGTSVPVGRTIAVIVEEQADVAKGSEFVVTDNSAAPAPAVVSAPAAAPVATSPAAAPVSNKTQRFGSSLDEAIAASGPGVARIAAGLSDRASLEAVTPTGRGGRFLKQDLAHLPNFEYKMDTAALSSTSSSSPAVLSPAAPALPAKKSAAVAANSSAGVILLKRAPVTNFQVSDTKLLRKLAAAAQKKATLSSPAPQASAGKK
jgi:pyruvate dehydrogenase E2 component (dihydrolipoamide acetyltransferase)